jgi:hypothetical protein
MFARGAVSLHTPPLLGRKPSSVKSCVSITSKLIQIKRLQLQHFGHLRKTGGRGMPMACHKLSQRYMPISSVLAEGCRLMANGCLPTPLFPLDTKIPLVSPFLPLLTQKQGGGYPLKNVGAPTFLIFPLIFRVFLVPSALRRATSASHRRSHRALTGRQEGWPSKGGLA